MSGIKIINQDQVVRMDWEFNGAELDLLALTILGKKKEIDADQIHAFVSGILEYSMIFNINHVKDKRAYMTASLKQQGQTDKYIESYFRGWDMVGSSDMIKFNKKEPYTKIGTEEHQLDLDIDDCDFGDGCECVDISDNCPICLESS